jgi:hypothetical protein
MPEHVVVLFFNSHNTNSASWHFLKCQNTLWLFKSSQDAKFIVAAVSLKPQSVLVVFFTQWNVFGLSA